jgi:quinol monooxygenase YgiN
MPTISASDSILTIINVFTVEPPQQARLVELLTKATESTVARVPGFISASLHASTDGKKVAMYAQWRSWEDYQRMRENPVASPFLAEALTFAKFDPGFYKVVRVFAPVD